MKKKNLKSLKLNKQSISELNPEAVKGAAATGGCTDGCGIFGSYWNCTKTNCTRDCSRAHGGASCDFITKVGPDCEPVSG
jgi:hypothetical protein